jgi:hypothetical protein
MINTKVLNYVPITLFALTLFGCTFSSYEKSAVRSAFGDSASCPDDRIVVSEIPRPAGAKPLPVPPPPPSDVAADPERLAVYQKAHGVDTYRYNKDLPFFEVEGCGQRHVYQCPLLPNPDGLTLSTSCQLVDPPAKRVEGRQ